MPTENATNVTLEKLKLETLIYAPKEKVWKILWDEESYNTWTKVFSENSQAVSDWNEGSSIQFLDGNGNGMYSVIDKKIPNEFMSFKHIGEIKEGKEQPVDEKTKGWSGCFENYTLKETDGGTQLILEMDIDSNYRDYFSETFPKALQKIKEMAEAKTKITVEAIIDSPIDTVWNLWNGPDHITKWNAASDDWHTPTAANDLQVGGKLQSRMEAKDGSMGFDFEGTYDEIKTNELIKYTMGDGRKVEIIFSADGSSTKVVETFEAEETNSIELQRGGWQAILDNFKKYVEENE